MQSIESNVIESESGICIYTDEIDRIATEYIERLPDKTMIFKPPVFSGMLNYVSQQYIIPVYKQIRQSKKTGYHDYKVLDSLFYYYIYLCSLYNNVPSVLGFCVFVGADRDEMTAIRNGVHKNRDGMVNPESHRIVKNWFNICENINLTAAASGSIGSMFILKCCYKYQEESQKIEIIGSYNPRQTADQIREKYRAAERPALPE